MCRDLKHGGHPHPCLRHLGGMGGVMELTNIFH